MDFGYKKLYIAGQLVDATDGARRDVVCPATGKSVATIAWAGKKDTARAVEAARKGFALWSAMSIAERNGWIKKLRDEVIASAELLQEAVMHEMGKTWESAAEDIESLINALEWYPQEMLHRRDQIIPDPDGTHRHLLVSEPRGVVVGILAWNFPLLNLSFKLGPALAAGCSIILKPSKESPVSAYIVGEICHRIGFPAGVVNVICGPAVDTSIPLCESTEVNVLTLIGSSDTGRKIIGQSSCSIKKMGMELGGNAPAIVFSDSNLEEAATLIAALKYGNCGQVCVSPNRIFVEGKVYDAFMKLFMNQVRLVKVGFGRGTGVTMGPLVSEEARSRVLEVIADAVARGARLTAGGHIPQGLAAGWFLEPTVLEGIVPGMRAYEEEMFGPVASIVRFDSEQQLQGMVNIASAGLSSYLFTSDHAKIEFYSHFLEYGEVHVNGCKYAIYLPHGGVKESGLGHDCSHLALDDYLHIKRITVKIEKR